MTKAASIGTFDGVHRGHIAVLTRLKEKAAEGRPVVFTFDCHPLEVVAPQRAPGRIMLPSAERRALEMKGVEVVVLHFDEELRRLTAREWMERLRDAYGVTHLVMGYDNTFGSDGLQMSLSDYRRLGAEVGIEVSEAPIVRGVSSSAIRKAVSEGDLQAAARMLGHDYALCGEVVGGDALGRTIGEPTANLKMDSRQLLPPPGVYCGECAGIPAVVNIGRRPTVTDSGEQRVEAHLIGFQGDLYGSTLEISLRARLRDERRFDSLEALRLQIEQDKASALKILSNGNNQL